MKEVYKNEFCCIHDFERVNAFISKTFGCEGTYNWDNARWSFNRYCIHNKEEQSKKRIWEDSVQLWVDNEGKIIGVAHIEEPGDYFFQVHPFYKYMEEEMLIWAIENCKRNFPDLRKIVVSSSYHDVERKKLFQKYNAKKLSFVDEHRVIELKREYPTPELPTGYRIIRLERDNFEACQKISDLYTRVWPNSSYIPNGETVASMSSSIAFKKEMSFVITDIEERYVAFTFAWVDGLNRAAHFYPIAVDPSYVGTNLLEIVILDALNTLFVHGYEKATISAWYTKEENEVFEKLGFVQTPFDEMYEINI
ncbi:hypothetical protein [Paenibacillus sp. 22594]|uniref:hypothetical protein n=1 Tax=Paenibacillus sp. 22594 TaxID=3453947 RepID=UPI003F838768